VAIADRGATPASGQASPRAESPEAEEPVDEAQAEAEGQKLRDIVSANSQHLELLDLKVVRDGTKPLAADSPLRSVKRSVIQKYHAAAFCRRCFDEGRSQQRYLLFARANALIAHLKTHANQEARVNGIPALRATTRETLAHWFASAGVSEASIRDFAAALGDRLSATPVQNPVSIGEQIVTEFAEANHRSMLAILGQSRFLCLSFDAGRWTHKGMHNLIAVVHTPQFHFVLPPHSSTQAYTADTIATTLLDFVEGISSDATDSAPALRHLVADGCTANEAAIKAINLFAELLEEVEAETVCAEAGDGETLNASRIARIETVLMAFRERMPSVQRISCMGHFVKNRVADVQKLMNDSETSAARLVRLVSTALYAEHGTSVRRTQLIAAIKATRDTDAKAIASDLRDLKSVMECLANLLTRPGGAHAAGAAEQYEQIRETISAESTPASVRMELPATVTDDATEAKLRQGIATLERYIKAAVASPRAARVATANQTRWHTSLFAAYVFTMTYLVEIGTFFTKHQSSDSAKEIAAMLASEDKRSEIYADLELYVTSLRPAASFLEKVSDVSVDNPLAEHAFNLYTQLLVELDKAPDGSPGKLLAGVVREKSYSYEPMRQTLGLLWLIQLFGPGTPVHWSQLYKEREKAGLLHARHVRAALNFIETEFPDAEWMKWLEERQRPVQIRSAVDFWQQPHVVGRYPCLHKVAQYCLAMPISVTSCDSVISVMGNAFTVRRNALNVAKAGMLLAFRCNGDFCGNTLKPSVFPSWTKRSKTQD
jgi:hypothetical protein